MLTDDMVLAIIEKMLKQRKDSIEQYKAGNRPDLAAKEEFEVGVLSAYMPQQLSRGGSGGDSRRRHRRNRRHVRQGHGQGDERAAAKVAGRADMGKLSAMVKVAAWLTVDAHCGSLQQRALRDAGAHRVILRAPYNSYR